MEVTFNEMKTDLARWWDRSLWEMSSLVLVVFSLRYSLSLQTEGLSKQLGR